MPGPAEPDVVSPWRQWRAIGWATFAATLGHASVLVASLLASAGLIGRGLEIAGVLAGLAGIGASVVLAVRLSDGGGVMRPLLWGGAVFAILAALRDEPVPVTALGFGLGVAAVLGVGRTAHAVMWLRWAIAAGTAAYTLIVMQLTPSFGVLVVPLLPFAAVGVADFTTSRTRRGHPESPQPWPRTATGPARYADRPGEESP